MKRRSLLILMLAALFAPLAMNGQTLFSEDFESGSMPSGWTTSGNGSWSVATAVNSSYPSSAGHGTYCAQIKHNTTGDATKLITPEIDLSSVTSAELSFMHVQIEWSPDVDELRVYYRTSSSGTWAQIAEYTTEYSSWTTESGIVLPNLSSTYQLAFEYTDNWGRGLGIDDIKIVPGASCPAPQTVSASNPTAHGAKISWAGSSGSYIVMVAEPVVNASYDFETGSMPSAFTNSSTNAWSVVANNHSGAYCAKSAGGFTSTNSDLSLTVNLAAAGSVDFSALVSSESGWDYGRFLIDGTQKFEVSGTSNSWEDYSFPLTAGSHTLIWRYYKDGSGNNGDDCFYVDDIVINEEPSSWYQYPAASSPYTLNDATNIHSATNYMVQVVGVCSGEQSDPSATVSFTTTETCPKPTNLQVTTDGATATVTWDGGATCNVNFDGTIYPSQTSGCSFPVQLSTTYSVAVEAVCSGETSGYCTPVSFTTPDCIGGHTIEYTLNDSYGDGWNGNAILIKDACDVIATLTIADGDSNSGTLTLCDGDYYQLTWQTGSYANETSFTLIVDGVALYTNQAGDALTDGQVLLTLGTAPNMLPKPTALTEGTITKNSVELSWTENGSATAWEICVNGDESNPVAANSNPFTLTGLTPDTDYTIKVRATNGTDVSCWTDEITVHTEEACAKPTNLAEDNITYTTVDLKWNGTSDSYVLQYRPWYPAGDDIIATGVTTTYTVDLSAYEGTGSVAIRHYDISDMFRLNVDDIVVTNANGQVVFSENFESGVMPSTFNNMDLDGDGWVWEIVTNDEDSYGNPTGNGTYCMASASYDNNYGVLHPDNWIIMSGLEMGGQISFAARGQDPSYAAENFAIYVSTDNSVVEVPVSATTYSLVDLTPNTPYAWQVKGICSDEESAFASSFFKTKDDMLVFATAGNWNDVSNWEDAEGNAVTALPTADNNVRIDAAATIPAGVVAVANKATIGTGSILIKDGGQLKQNSASLRVTMEKEIAGYGESDGYYYFIASPFNGRTLYSTSGSFSHVDNMLTGEYDLYAFDATASDGLEWINYKSSPTHIAFQADNGLEGLLYGEGYLYANQEGTTIEFEGTAGKSNNYSETKDYTYNDGDYDWDGWALVGNFFTCNAYINYVDANGNVLDADFYTLNLDNTYSLMSSNQPLPPCTGALMNVSATGKVQYSTEAPAKRASFLNMNVSRGNKNVGQARLRFGQGHNLGSMSFRNGSRLYMNVDGNDYAVVYTEKQGEMPVSFKADESGTYTISFNNEEVSFGYLHLIDNMTGADVDLLQTPSYTFDARTSDYESRFRLVFATGSSVDGDSFGFVNESGNFCIFGIEGEATVQVIDILGHVLSNETFSGSYEKKINGAPGVYMVRLIQGNDVKIQKVVVR